VTAQKKPKAKFTSDDEVEEKEKEKVKKANLFKEENTTLQMLRQMNVPAKKDTSFQSMNEYSNKMITAQKGRNGAERQRSLDNEAPITRSDIS